MEKYFAAFISSRMRCFTFFRRSSIYSFWIVDERYVVMPLLQSWKTERCSLMTALYFASNFKVSRKFPWFLQLESSRWPRKGRFCLYRNFMTSATLCRISLHLFFFLIHEILHFFINCLMKLKSQCKLLPFIKALLVNF